MSTIISEPLMTTIHEINDRYGTIFDNLIEGVQIIGFDHRYLYVNDAAVIQNKFSREELIGRTQIDMYPGIENTEVFALIDKSLKERTSQSMEAEFKFPDGSLGWYDVRCEPIPYGVLILSLDITRRKLADVAERDVRIAELEKKIRELEASS